MTSLEDLKSRLEALEFEKQRLEVDNLRLRTEQHDSLRELERYRGQLSPGHEGNEMETLQSDYQLLEMVLSLARATLDEQGDQHKEDQERISELTAELFEKTELELRCQELKEQVEKLTGELERRELEQFRAVEREKTRWEKREELLQRQVKLLRETRRTEINRRTEDTPPRVRASASVQTDRGRGSPSATTEVQSQMGSSESTPSVGEEPATSMLTSALLAHQLPPLSKFTGEGVHGSEGDTFGDWLEQFELCAGVCQWDARAKLLNLVTRLKGAAYSFYKSCSVQHRSDYGELVKELTRRFTPVRIQAVQCSLFHECKQSGKESVDDFSQDLRKLFAHAYPKVEQGSREAEAMGL